ncbi:MAG: MFS transporter [Deltaproteobacteria bacterium]|jgi:nitrate/nitrite transporter NarK|nr:MFS transporter [Deltaproteobacteria bacterium]
MEELWDQRWRALWFVAFLGFVFSANYTNHGPLVPTLVKQLEITFAMAGFLTTAIFLTHGALQIPGGALADKFGAKKLVTYALFIIAAGNVLIGLSNTYYAILVLKFIIGIGTGICFISGARYVTTFFLGKEIQRAQGVYGGTILLGSGFVIYCIPQLLPLVGWHNIFMITGGMAAVLLVLWFFFAPNTPAAATSQAINWNSVFGSRNIWLLSLAQLATFGEIIACGVWVNTLLIRSIHLHPKAAGIIGSAALLLGILSRPLGGLILDHKVMSTRRLLVASSAGLALGFVWIGFSSSVIMAVSAIIFTGIMAGLPFAGIFNAARDNCPDCPGVAMGFVNTWGAIGVMIFPPVIGWLVDTTGTFLSGFFVLGAVALISALGCMALSLADSYMVSNIEPVARPE